jgi:hypothetical protein
MPSRQPFTCPSFVCLSFSAILAASPPIQAADTYDATNGTLALPAVRIAGTGTTFNDVVVDPGTYRIVSVGGTTSKSVTDRYVPASRRLAMPTVTVGASRIDNVLLELGEDMRILSVGGSTTTTSKLPRESAASSYENKITAAAELGTQILPAEVQQGNAVAFADFFQEGNLGMVTHSLEYNYSDISTATEWGHVRFYRRENGAWTDRTSRLLADTAGCLHPRKAVVADFNRDGQPDVFFACHGFDADPWPGEQPLLLLSQPDGTYISSKLPVTGFFHSASAGDIDGDGFPDLLLTDNMGRSTPYFLINNRDGSFTVDESRLPDGVRYRPIFTAELVDFFGTGHYDAFLAGHESDSFNALATLYPNDGTGYYRTTTPVVMPRLTGYGFATDVVFVGQNIYLARTIDDSAHFYGGAAIQKVSYPAMTSQSLYASTGFLPKAENWPWATSWINWIIPYRSSIVTLDSGYGISVSQ